MPWVGRVGVATRVSGVAADKMTMALPGLKEPLRVVLMSRGEECEKWPIYRPVLMDSCGVNILLCCGGHYPFRIHFTE